MNQNHKKTDNIVSDYISGANGRNRNSQRKTKHIVTYNLYQQNQENVPGCKQQQPP